MSCMLFLKAFGYQSGSSLDFTSPGKFPPECKDTISWSNSVILLLARIDSPIKNTPKMSTREMNICLWFNDHGIACHDLQAIAGKGKKNI